MKMRHEDALKWNQKQIQQLSQTLTASNGQILSGDSTTVNYNNNCATNVRKLNFN